MTPPERYPELYFTTYEPGGHYGPVILSNNTFTTGPEALAAIRFEAGAQDVLVSGNVITGATTSILIEGDAEVTAVTTVPADHPATPATQSVTQPATSTR